MEQKEFMNYVGNQLITRLESKLVDKPSLRTGFSASSRFYEREEDGSEVQGVENRWNNAHLKILNSALDDDTSIAWDNEIVSKPLERILEDVDHYPLLQVSRARGHLRLEYGVDFTEYEITTDFSKVTDVEIVEGRKDLLPIYVGQDIKEAICIFFDYALQQNDNGSPKAS